MYEIKCQTVDVLTLFCGYWLHFLIVWGPIGPTALCVRIMLIIAKSTIFSFKYILTKTFNFLFTCHRFVLKQQCFTVISIFCYCHQMWKQSLWQWKGLPFNTFLPMGLYQVKIKYVQLLIFFVSDLLSYHFDLTVSSFGLSKSHF